MQLINEAVERISSAEPADLRERLYNALLDSVALPNKKDPYSAQQLVEAHTVPPEVLSAYLVVLRTSEVSEFLESLSKTVATTSFFRNKLSPENYKRVFDRKRAKAGREYVYSYAEILFLAGLARLRISVPRL